MVDSKYKIAFQVKLLLENNTEESENYSIRFYKWTN